MRFIRFGVVLPALVSTVLLGPPARAENNLSTIRHTIKRLMVERHTPSIAVAVARGGQILWEEGFGFADVQNKVPATPDTMYSLASISKPVTGAALMTLVAAGKLNLDRPINDYLGDAKLVARIGNAADATVRRVANHSSGLPEHYQFFYRNEPWPVPSQEVTIARYGNLVTIPGEHFQYSNLGYGILSYVIERISGESFSSYIQKNIFDKLGMTHSAVGDDGTFSAFEAVRYGEDQRPIPPYDTDHPGASEIYASAHDLVRFGMFGLKAHPGRQPTVLTDELIDEMQAPTMDEGGGTGYGVGWETSTIGGVKMMAHTGGMPGVATELRLIPSRGLVIVVLCNALDNQLTHIITDGITAAQIPGWSKPVPEEAPSSVVPAALAGKWKGHVSTYRGDIPFSLEITGDGDVRAKLGNQLETLLNAAHLRSDGFLRGVMYGNLGIEDATRRPYVLGLNLKLRPEGTLNGVVTARADMNGVSPTFKMFPAVNGYPAPTQVQNETFILGQWAELKKQ